MIWRKHAILTPPTDEEMVAMAPNELIDLHSIYHEAIDVEIIDEPNEF